MVGEESVGSPAASPPSFPLAVPEQCQPWPEVVPWHVSNARHAHQLLG